MTKEFKRRSSECDEEFCSVVPGRGTQRVPSSTFYRRRFIRTRSSRRFDEDHKDWSVEDWSGIVCSDESSFSPSPAHLTVRWRPGEAYKPQCLTHTVYSTEGSVVICGDLQQAWNGAHLCLWRTQAWVKPCRRFFWRKTCVLLLWPCSLTLKTWAPLRTSRVWSGGRWSWGDGVSAPGAL